MQSASTTPAPSPAGRAAPVRSRRWWHLPRDRESLDEFCERGILGTVLAILVFGPLATGATRTSQFLVLMGLTVVLVSFWLVRIWIRRQYRFLFPPFGWAVLAFTAYAAWRYTAADIEFLARLELLQIILYALLFFAVLDNLSRQESTQILLFTLVFLGMALSFYAVYQYFTDSPKILWFDKPPVYKGRGSGTYICPNHLAGYLEMVLPIALACTITGRYKPLTKVFIGYAALAIIAGIGVTVSRGGYIAMGASLVLFFGILLWNRDFRLPAIGILVLLLVGGSFFGFRSWQTHKRFADLEQVNMRSKYWEPAVKLWKENSLFGIGANHYDWRFRPHRFWKLQGRPMYVHNDYLQTLTEYGTVGMGIIAAGLAALTWGVFKTWKYVRRTTEIATKPSNRSAVVLGCSVGLLAILVHSVPDFNMHIPANAAVAVTLMAVLTSQLRFATERFWLNPGVFGRLMGTLVLLAGAALFTWQISRLAPHVYYRSKLEKAATFPEQVALLEKAYAVEPQNSEVTLQLGETLRTKAWEGNEGWEQLLHEAVGWYDRSIALNRWDPENYYRKGMALHWLGQPEQAAQLFDKALELDPNSYYVLCMYGWHLLQLGDLPGAKEYFQKSFSFFWDDNPMATNYLALIERRLAEQQETR